MCNNVRGVNNCSRNVKDIENLVCCHAHLDKILRHPRVVKSSLWRVRLNPVILVKQPIPRLLPHVDNKLLEAEALVVNDRGC